jgi:hypothetical protein
VREHFHAGLDYQDKLARFLENHDEPRAATAFPAGQHEAAAVITFLAPGLRFFHQGQFEGRQKRISPHLVRAPNEPVIEKLSRFYERLLAVLRQPELRDGNWQLLECVPAWEGNWTVDCILAFAWQQDAGDPFLVTVNYAPHQSQCRVRLPFPGLAARAVRLKDMIGPAENECSGDELVSAGLYLDLPAWGCHVFTTSPKADQLTTNRRREGNHK